VFTAERPIRVQIDGRCKRVEEDGMAKAHAVRLDDETTEWLDRYAEERGTDKGTILRSAIESFRDDCERGVPELRRAAREQTYVRDKAAELEQGVGVCPKRAPGLGHVWAGVHASGDSRNPCRFCGTPGRQARDAQGRPVGEPGFFEKATDGRSDVFRQLRAPASVKKWAGGAK
jgi:predicted transcriptional regulator